MTLLAATLVALAWANVQASSYQMVWGTQVSVRVGDAGLSQDLRQRGQQRLCLSSGGWLGSALVGQDAPVDDVGQAPLQRPAGLSRVLPSLSLRR